MNIDQNARLSIAPMMDWTDRHCRFFHRQLSKHALLYTEMVTAPAVVHGDRDRLLGFDTAEHPLAVQLGGSEPELLAQAAKICTDWGYDEINLNVGCPSDRVQSGAFGAVLMKDPALVRDCVDAMMQATSRPVTVKCRIGVDDQEPRKVLPAFLETVSDAGVERFVIHARKAWLDGLSPKQNRDIPPLDYDLVRQMKRQFSHLWIGINGGISDLEQARKFLDEGLDGVMIGRAAYHYPADILMDADRMIWGAENALTKPEEAVAKMFPYIEQEVSRGTRLNAITRHMLGLFTGLPGARKWRRHLSENAHINGAGPEVVEQALAFVKKLDAA